MNNWIEYQADSAFHYWHVSNDEWAATVYTTTGKAYIKVLGCEDNIIVWFPDTKEAMREIERAFE